jgi:cysteine-rich repeat protein
MKVRHVALLFPLSALLFLAACGEENGAEQPTLAAALSATATTLTVNRASALPTGGGTLQIDAERIDYTKRSGTSVAGLIRGMQGTTAAAHAVGALVQLVSSEPPETPAPTLTATTTTAPTSTTTSLGSTPTPTQTSSLPTSTPTDTLTPAPTLTSTLSPTLTPTATQLGEAVCGNGIQESGEQCDDGNLWGGDGCAANCTHEIPAGCLFGCVNDGETCSGATVRTVLFEIPLDFTGDQTLTAGHPRNEVVTTTDAGITFRPNEIPVILRAADLHVAPVSVPGLVCACVRAEATDQFGPGLGNAGSGRIGCNEAGLADVDYVFKVDHNVTPGSPGNGGGLPDDPGCVQGELEDGSPQHPHAGVCNTVGKPYFTGGGPRGSTVVLSSTSITLIDDAGMCSANCSIADYGPDCEPCTSDDLVHEPASSLATTTGVASAVIYDANNMARATIDTTVTGMIVECDALLDDPNHPDLSGSALVSAFGKLDQPKLGDSTTTSVFACVMP